MSNVYTSNALRFLTLLLIQGLILQNIALGQVNMYIYPLFILLLPIEMPHALIVILGFFYGLLIDMFYDMDGLHAAATTLIAFARPAVCAIIEPRGGYEIGQTLTKHSLGIRWFINYSAILMLIHLFIVITLEELEFSLMWILRLTAGFSLSMALIILYQFIFNPK
ncbi:MAG: rod shape-determining protein MreD [Aureispira sp.]|nr:rod shape-determining protein MreD [Aureispira sp.]